MKKTSNPAATEDQELILDPHGSGDKKNQIQFPPGYNKNEILNQLYKKWNEMGIPGYDKSDSEVTVESKLKTTEFRS